MNNFFIEIGLNRNLLALVRSIFGVVGTIEEFSLEQLYGYDGEYELEEAVHNKNVHYVFERIDHTVEHCLELWNSVNRLQRPQNPQNSQRLHRTEILSCTITVNEKKGVFWPIQT